MDPFSAASGRVSPPEAVVRGGFVEEAEYKTSDLYFASYLRVAGVTFVSASREQGRVVFVFESRGAAVMRDLKREYFMDRAKVPALSFVQMLRRMKTLTHDTR